MSKRFSLSFLILLVFAFSAFAGGISGKFGLEARGGYALISPTDLNKSLENVFGQSITPFASTTTMATFLKSSDAKGSPLSGMLQVDGALKYMASPNLAILLKFGFLYTESTDSVIDNDTGDAIMESHVAFNIGYFGLGGRYYIGDGPSFFPYIGLDGGIFMNFKSFWEVWMDPESDIILDNMDLVQISKDGKLYTIEYSDVDFKDMMFGGNIELGMEYLFTPSVGVNLGVGYRLASGKVTMPEKGIFTDGNVKLSEINLSGLYFGGGLTTYFGGAASTSAASTQSGAAQSAAGAGSAAQKYEQYGDYYYKLKKYNYAARYYYAAQKAAPNNAGIYKKLAFTYYYMKDMKRAKAYGQYYLRLNPNDSQIQGWINSMK